MWRVGRAVYGTCLENKHAGMHLGFESLTLRQTVTESGLWKSRFFAKIYGEGE